MIFMHQDQYLNETTNQCVIYYFVILVINFGCINNHRILIINFKPQIFSDFMDLTNLT